MIQPTPHLKILVVDSERKDYKHACQLITQLGHHATVASSGQEMLDKIAKEPFELAFLELNLSDMDGFNLVSQLQQVIERCPPLVALTATEDPAIVKRCFLAGMDHFILKPLTIENLHAALNLFLSKKNLKEKRIY